MRSSRKLITFVSCGLSLSALLMVSPAWADCLIAGSNERLTNFCLVERSKDANVPLSFAIMLDTRLKRVGHLNGLGFPMKVKRTDFTPFASPVLYYSTNINGGNPKKKLVLGNRSFSGDPNLIRKTGILIGATSGLKGRSIYGDGKYIDLNLTASHAYSPKHQTGVTNLSGAICSQNQIKNNLHLDACVGLTRIKKQITDQKNKYLSLSILNFFTSSPFLQHQNTLEATRYFEKNYTQNQFSLTHQTLNKTGYLSNLTLTIGEPVDNQLVTRRALNWSLEKHIENRKIAISANLRMASGGKVFGFDRNEKTRLLSLSYQLFKNLEIGFGYSKTDSNIDYFSASQPIFTIQFPAITF